jgi:hypothetical protein
MSLNLNGPQLQRGPYVARQLLEPDDAAVILIDHQPAMIFAIESHSAPSVVRKRGGARPHRQGLRDADRPLTIAADRIAGPLIPEVRAAHPDAQIVDRPGAMNAWEDEGLVAAVEATGRRG